MTREALIRDYQEADAGRLVPVLRELQDHLRPLFDRLRPPTEIGRWYLDALLGACDRQAGRIRLAEVDGEIAGYAVILTRVTSEDEEEIDEVLYTFAHVAELLVRAPWRGQGLGRLLLEDCEAIARQAGVRWLRVTSLAANAGALRTYEAFGFRPHLVNLEKALNPDRA